METKVNELTSRLGWSINPNGSFDYSVGKNLQLNEFEEYILFELVEKYKSTSESYDNFIDIVRKHCLEKNIMLEKSSAEKIIEFLER